MGEQVTVNLPDNEDNNQPGDDVRVMVGRHEEQLAAIHARMAELSSQQTPPPAPAPVVVEENDMNAEEFKQAYREIREEERKEEEQRLAEQVAAEEARKAEEEAKVKEEEEKKPDRTPNSRQKKRTWRDRFYG